MGAQNLLGSCWYVFFLFYPRPPCGVPGRHLLEQPPEGRSKQILHQQRYEIDAVALTTPFPETVARRMPKRLDGTRRDV